MSSVINRCTPLFGCINISPCCLPGPSFTASCFILEMLRFTCFALLVALAAGIELKLQLNNQWQQFKSLHKKKYSGDEDVKRQENFKKNVEAILQHNLKKDMGTETFTQGVNEFSDLSHEEFVKTMLGFNGNRNISTRAANPFVWDRTIVYPASLDWRTIGAVTFVRNQGQCGSCWTHSTVGAVEGAWFRKTGQQVILSEQNLLDCVDKNWGCFGCDGGFPDRAMEYVMKNGIDTRSCYPYYGQELGYCNFQAQCKAATISGYVMIPEGDEAAMKQGVFKGGPMSVGFDAGQPSIQNYRSGIYNPSYCSQQGNHVVLLVGYGTENGRDYWLIKNSWGTSWGEQGYFKMARNAGNKCGIANYAQYVIP